VGRQTGSVGTFNTIGNGHETRAGTKPGKVRPWYLSEPTGDDTARPIVILFDAHDCTTSCRTVQWHQDTTHGEETLPDYSRAVETQSGYDFFSNLPEPIQRCVEAGTNGNNPPLDTDADTVPDSTDNCPFVANTNQANYDGDSMGDACDPDDDNDGQTDADEIACGSNPMDASSKSDGHRW
jgi:hypothetical protein